MKTNAPIILMPVFNDWTACSQLLDLVDGTLQSHGLSARVLLVDDGSTLDPPAALTTESHAALESVQILPLRQNMGHQRAIAIGLSYVSEHFPDTSVVVMDSDGEDDPADVPRLLAKCTKENNRKIVMAIRAKRSESLLFRLCYLGFKTLFRCLAGRRYQMGNFSVIPASQLPRLVGNSGLWCHYAATVFRSRIPYVGLATIRSKRLDGKSQMNFVSLVMHGFSAIAVYLDIASIRMMILCLLGVCLLGLVLAGIVVARFCTPLAIPNWAGMALAITLLLMGQLVSTTAVLTFLSLANRQSETIVPIKVYKTYLAKDPLLPPPKA